MLLSLPFSTYEAVPALVPASSADTTGLVREYARFASMLRSVRRGDGLPEEWDRFAHPVFTQNLEDEQEAYLRAHAEVPESVKETPDVPDEELLDAILAEHRGKPVLVDIWATWCTPCLAGIQALEPLKTTDYADVDFVYLTGETSPKSTWLEIVPTIRGDHYYLTDKQLKFILDRLGSDGYPTYFVVRRNGMNGSVLVGYNEDKLKNLLNKALK
jgi:thiol-disulfide isomerase/thioredoxin